MTDEITPALTPEEWANARDSGLLARRLWGVEENHFRDRTPGVIGWPDELEFTPDGNAVCACCDCFEKPRHAVAALALYGQPFGFTHEDVRDLRVRADHEEEAAAMMGSRHPSSLRSLADRIAALLPPEEP